MALEREIFGHQVLHKLGVGARSIIYEVLDPATKKKYALKRVLRSDPALDDPCIAQVEVEYETSSKLDHPNLRKSYQLFRKKRWGFLGTSEVGLLMELVSGKSLIERNDFDHAQRLEIFRQTAEALAAMHKAGYVHADMKPHNIIVSPDGQTVKVVDFGQSCPLGTVKERVQGTPDYIAPEQVVKGAIDARTDIYNLGATMYWAFTGQNMPSVFDSITSGLPAASVRVPPPRAVKPDLPEDINQLIAQCLKPDRRERPADMAAVARRLDQLLDTAEPTPVD